MDKYKFWYQKRNSLNLESWFYEIIEIEFIKQSLNDFDIRCGKLASCYGLCYYKSRQIDICIEHHRNLGQLIDTIAHEVAHIKVGTHCRMHTKCKNLLKKIIKSEILSNWSFTAKEAEELIYD